VSPDPRPAVMVPERVLRDAEDPGAKRAGLAELGEAIEAEDERVLFGFWRGKRLRTIEPALKPGGKYEMATFEIREDTPVSLAVVRRLAKEAAALNKKLGDPTRGIKAR